MNERQRQNIRMLTACLRTDRFQQITKMPYGPGNMRCVQGVAMDLAGLDMSSSKPKLLRPFYGLSNPDLATYGMPPIIQHSHNHDLSIVSLNDTGVTFSQLADLIDYWILGEPSRSGGKVTELAELVEV